MAEPKPLASLSSGLLARKGQAKPAMRRQGFDGMAGFSSNGHDDLGWNDMGHDDGDGDHGDTPVHHQLEELERSIAAVRQTPSTGLTPIGQEPEQDEDELVGDSAEEALDDEAVEDVVEDAVVTETVAFVAPVVAAPVAEQPVLEQPLPLPTIAISRVKREAAGRAKAAKGKAAFTLRLDNERHLKLRLASAIERVSAQQLVTVALDRFLASMPELETIAGTASDHRKH